MAKKIKKEKHLQCDECRKNKPDVREDVIDPYVEEIDEEIIYRNLCDDCYQSRLDEI